MAVEDDYFSKLIDNAEMVASVAVDLYLSDLGKTREECNQRWLRFVSDDMAHHIRHFAASIRSPSDKALLDYLIWLKVLFTGLKVKESDITTSFHFAGLAATRYLPPEAATTFTDLAAQATSIYPDLDPAGSRFQSSSVNIEVT